MRQHVLFAYTRLATAFRLLRLEDGDKLNQCELRYLRFTSRIDPALVVRDIKDSSRRATPLLRSRGLGKFLEGAVRWDLARLVREDELTAHQAVYDKDMFVVESRYLVLVRPNKNLSRFDPYTEKVWAKSSRLRMKDIESAISLGLKYPREMLNLSQPEATQKVVCATQRSSMTVTIYGYKLCSSASLKKYEILKGKKDGETSETPEES